MQKKIPSIQFQFILINTLFGYYRYIIYKTWKIYNILQIQLINIHGTSDDVAFRRHRRPLARHVS
jgi:hypothetical protein